MFVVLGMGGFCSWVAFCRTCLAPMEWFDYDPDRFFKALEISVKVAGLSHSKVSSHVLSLILGLF